MTTENTNPELEQEQLPTQEGQPQNTEEDDEEVEPTETTEEIVTRELSTIPFAEKEGVKKYAKDEDLVRVSEIAKDVKKFKKKFSPDKFKLNGLEDKDGVKKIFDARKFVRDYRLPVEEEREAKVGPHNATVKYYNERYKPLIAEMKKIEGALKEKEDDFKVQLEKEKQRVEQEKRDKISKRVDRLQAAGAAWSGEFYCVGDKKLDIEEKGIGMIDIETASDTLFEDILVDYKRIADLVTTKEAQAKEEKRLQRIEEDRLETQRQEQLLLDQAEVKRQQKVLDDARIEQEEKTKKLNEKITVMRRKELLSLGLTHDPGTNKYYFVTPVNSFPFEHPIHEFEDEAWEAALDFIGKKIGEIKEADAAREKLTLERQTQLVELGFVPVGQQYVYKSSCRIDVSRFTASEEDWNKIIDYAKGCIEKANAVVEAPVIPPAPPVEEKKDEKEPERPVRNFGGGGGGISMAEASDKKQWDTFKALLSAIDIPQFKTSYYIAKATDVKEKINEIISL